MNPNDLRYASLCDKLISDCNLVKDERIGFFFRHNIGENYFHLSAIPYIQKLTGKKFVVIANKNMSLLNLIKGFQNNGIMIDYEIVDDDIVSIYEAASEDIKKRYSGIIQPIFDNLSYEAFPGLFQWLAEKEVIDNLARPSFKFLSSEVESKIAPGKTVFVIPDADYHNSPEPRFWTSAISLFQALGFAVLVNSKHDPGWGEGVEHVYPGIDEMAPIADRCGYVFAIRTGVSELVASLTTARMIMVDCKPANCQKYFEPTMARGPGNTLHYFPIPNVRDTGFKAMDSWAAGLAASRSPYRAYLERSLNPLFENARKIAPELRTFWRSYSVKPFQKRMLDRAPAFCGLRYSLATEADLCFMRLYISPPGAYQIYARLVDAATGAIEQELEYITGSILIFQIPATGQYIVEATGYLDDSDLCWMFATEKFAANLPLESAISRTTDYAKYIQQLAKLMPECVILIATSDTHCDESRSMFLNFKALGLSPVAEHLYRAAYIAVIDGGKVALEAFSEESDIAKKYRWGINQAALASSHFSGKGSHPVSITLNGVEYAPNRRGLNIVVWSKKESRVIDSVAFDTFSAGAPAFRG